MEERNNHLLSILHSIKHLSPMGFKDPGSNLHTLGFHKHLILPTAPTGYKPTGKISSYYGDKQKPIADKGSLQITNEEKFDVILSDASWYQLLTNSIEIHALSGRISEPDNCLWKFILTKTCSSTYVFQEAMG